MTIKIQKRIHNVHKEWEKAKEMGVKISKLVGKYQYIYSSENGKISLIKVVPIFNLGSLGWEIYCLEGDLFDDVEKFKTRPDAEKRIEELL